MSEQTSLLGNSVVAAIVGTTNCHCLFKIIKLKERLVKKIKIFIKFSMSQHRKMFMSNMTARLSNRNNNLTLNVILFAPTTAIYLYTYEYIWYIKKIHALLLPSSFSIQNGNVRFENFLSFYYTS